MELFDADVDEEVENYSLKHKHSLKPEEYLDTDAVESSPSILQIDLDSKVERVQFLTRYVRFQKQFNLGKADIKPSKTKGHFHAYVELKTPIESELERIALQAILGSDWVREALNYRRVKEGISPAIIFYEPKGSK